MDFSRAGSEELLQLALLKCSDKAKEVRRLGLVLLATLALPTSPEEVHLLIMPLSTYYRPGAAPRAATLSATPRACRRPAHPLHLPHTLTMLPPYRSGA